MIRSVISAVVACVAVYVALLLGPNIMLDFMSSRAWTLRPSLSVTSSGCLNTIGNIHYCRIAYEDTDPARRAEGSFDVLYAGDPPARISLVASTRFPSHVSASFVTGHVKGRIGLFMVVAAVAALSLGIGIAPWIMEAIRLYRHRNDETMVLVRVSASEPKRLPKGAHAGLQRLKKLGS